MSVEFDTPANRILQQLQPKNQFRIDTSLPELTFLRQLSIQGRLRYDFRTFTVTDTFSITPTIGETRFIYQIIINLGVDIGRWQFDISNNGNLRSRIVVETTTAIRNDTFTYNLFDSLVGDGIKSIDIIASELAGTASSPSITVLGWSENTSRIRDVTT